MTIYSFVRTDWNDKLDERGMIFDYLNGVRQAHSQYEVGKRALQLMITERMSQGSFAEAIGHAQTAVTNFSGELKQETTSQLIMLLLRIGQVRSAEDLFAAYKTEYPKDVDMHGLLQGMFDHIEHDLAHGRKIDGGLARPAVASAINAESNTPTEFSISPNYPNPFNPTTEIHYALPSAGDVKLVIFNMLGEQVRVLVDGIKSAGEYQIAWDGKNQLGQNVASGIYIYRIFYQPSESLAQVLAHSGKMSLLR